MKKHSILCRLAVVLLLSWVSAAFAADDNQIYYVQHSFYAYKHKFVTTNYHIDTLIPINSRAKITDMGGSEMEIQLPDMQNMEVTIKNIEKYTHKNMQEIKDRMLGKNKVDLGKFSKPIADAIKTGQVKVGMTKKEVLLAYGYPPVHKTPSLDDSRWTYWKTKWNRVILTFQDGKLSNIRD